MAKLNIASFKGVLLGAIATSLLALPFAAGASVVTVWDTLPTTPQSNGMAVGSSSQIFSGVQFVPTQSGYFVDFAFTGQQSQGTADWVFTLHSNYYNSQYSRYEPGSVLETLSPVDVGATAGVYNGPAHGTTFLSAGTTYWLMAQLPSDSSGVWTRIGTGTGTRAWCALGASGCLGNFYNVFTDGTAGALQVRVETSPVPLPAAAWLLLSGLTGLGFVGRRKAA